MSEKSIYSIDLHETMNVEHNGHLATSIMRVPGGWIYRSFDKEHQIMCGVFVPFDNEYQDEDDEFTDYESMRKDNEWK